MLLCFEFLFELFVLLLDSLLLIVRLMNFIIFGVNVGKSLLLFWVVIGVFVFLYFFY